MALGVCCDREHRAGCCLTGRPHARSAGCQHIWRWREWRCGSSRASGRLPVSGEVRSGPASACSPSLPDPPTPLARCCRRDKERKQRGEAVDSPQQPPSRLAEAAAEFSEAQQAFLLSSPSGLGVGAEAAIARSIAEGALDNLPGRGGWAGALRRGRYRGTLPNRCRRAPASVAGQSQRQQRQQQQQQHLRDHCLLAALLFIYMHAAPPAALARLVQASH